MNERGRDGSRNGEKEWREKEWKEKKEWKEDAVTEINAAGDAPKKGMSPTDTLLDQLNAKMDVACGLLAGSHQEIKDRCDEFEALLNAPERTMASIRRSQVLVRAAAMKSMGLTTSYLTVLSDYMKQLEKGQLEKGQLEKGH